MNDSWKCHAHLNLLSCDFFEVSHFFWIFFYIFQWDSHFLPIIITYYYFETRKLHICYHFILNCSLKSTDLWSNRCFNAIVFRMQKNKWEKRMKKKWSRNLMWHTWVLKCNVNCKSDAKIIPSVNLGNFYICNSSDGNNSSDGSDSSICAVSLPLAVGSLDYLLVGLLIDGDEMQTHTHINTRACIQIAYVVITWTYLFRPIYVISVYLFVIFRLLRLFSVCLLSDKY